MSGLGQVIGLGVVGAGNIAGLNVAGYIEHPNCEIVAVCDPVEGRAQTAADLWGAGAAYTNLDDLLADPRVDAVEILTPTHLHREHVLAAVAAGKHVSCQKPLANTVDESLEMTAAAEAAGVVLRVSECFWHYPPLEKAKALIETGAIGKPTNIRIRTIVGQTDAPFQANLNADGYGWRLDKRSTGGHLFDDMVHKFATALWLVPQDIVRVQATVRRRDLFFEPCNTIFEYEDPMLLGAMEVTYAPKMWMNSSYYGADEFFEIQGDEGFIQVTRCTGELLDVPRVILYQGVQGNPTTTSFSPDSDWGSGFRRSSEHFIDSLLGGTTPDMTGADAARVLQLCFAVYQASNTGVAVDPRSISTSVVPEGWAEW